MSKVLTEKLTLDELEREIETIKNPLFIYETLQSKKELKEGRIKGPFKTGKEVIEAMQL